MSEEKNPWQLRFERERKARKESETLLEEKSLELWKINQDLEAQVSERTESLKEALLNAEKADRAKSDFLANMSHEIRTPLNAIIGFSQFLSKSDDLNKTNSKYASIIESSATSLLTIINDILDFSKIESGNFDIQKDDSNIFEISTQVVELFSQKASEKHIRLDFNFNENIPNYIFTDGVRIRQVISNLISNAIKFTPEHGEVKLNINLIDYSNSIVNIRFEVIDSGIGIPDDKIESILNPFIQLEHVANKKHVGTGLGLSICSHILKLLDSNLEVKSEVGKGSCFCFDLEAEVSKNLNEENHNINVEETSSFIGKVLVAEDNSANQELMKLILSDLGIEATIAANGKEALDIYKEDNSFDMILMDINMPILNGVEAFYQIRIYEDDNNLSSTPIVALTANAIKGDKDRFIALGMDDYLSKPIEVNAFKKVASKYLKVSNSLFDFAEDESKSIEKSYEIDIKKISERIGVGENIVQMIVNKFKADIEKDLNELKQYINNEEIENSIQKAHYIKNSCLNVALDDASMILEELESKDLSFYIRKEKFNKLSQILLNLK